MKLVPSILRKAAYMSERIADRFDKRESPVSSEMFLPQLRQEFQQMRFGAQAMQKLLDDYPFETVLDIGSGAGEQADLFLAHDKKVTAIDYGRSHYFEQKEGSLNTIIADFNTHNFLETYDCVWASHILEHQLNVQQFLEKIHSVTREDGVVAITVPPLKHEIVGGHVSLWNGGLLLYRLVLAGFDCRAAAVLAYDYNISVIVRKKTIHVLDKIVYDAGDIATLRPYLPPDLEVRSSKVDQPFDGNIRRLNW